MNRVGGPLSLGIVTVSYGHAEILGELIGRLESQRGSADQIVVVDNGTDNVAGRLQGMAGADSVITTGQNIGFAAGCNLGAAQVATDVVLLLNPDCLPEEGFLDAMRHPPEDWDAWMGLVATNSGRTVNTAGGVAHYSGIAWSGRYGTPVEDIDENPVGVGFLSGACMAVRRPVWQTMGGLVEDFFMYVEDVELSHRLRLAGHRFGVLPTARVRHDYEFHKGTEKWRLLERNRWITVLRTYPTPVLMAALPVLIALEPMLLAAAVRGGWLGAKLRSWVDIWRAVPTALVERRRIQKQTTVSAREFSEGLTAELDSPFLGTVGQSLAAARLSHAYWALARRAMARR